MFERTFIFLTFSVSFAAFAVCWKDVPYYFTVYFSIWLKYSLFFLSIYSLSFSLSLFPGSLSIREVAELLDQSTLQILKKECGGLQTLLKNSHQVFKGMWLHSQMSFVIWAWLMLDSSFFCSKCIKRRYFGRGKPGTQRLSWAVLEVLEYMFGLSSHNPKKYKIYQDNYHNEIWALCVRWTPNHNLSHMNICVLKYDIWEGEYESIFLWRKVWMTIKVEFWISEICWKTEYQIFKPLRQTWIESI